MYFLNFLKHQENSKRHKNTRKFLKISENPTKPWFCLTLTWNIFAMPIGSTRSIEPRRMFDKNLFALTLYHKHFPLNYFSSICCSKNKKYLGLLACSASSGCFLCRLRKPIEGWGESVRCRSDFSVNCVVGGVSVSEGKFGELELVCSDVPVLYIWIIWWVISVKLFF